MTCRDRQCARTRMTSCAPYFEYPVVWVSNLSNGHLERCIRGEATEVAHLVLINHHYAVFCDPVPRARPTCTCHFIARAN